MVSFFILGHDGVQHQIRGGRKLFIALFQRLLARYADNVTDQQAGAFLAPLRQALDT